ncbi:MAG: hypothetical protein MR639_14685 [Clostridium sp.]|uniref:hypothetical protein n=1 Tax=Clostridium sp. TaxID=1506 RepID=UPI002A8815A4|nr:hypothetical protein [Clostridium sp.]MDY5097827.1 hypothetical protein [Clostridium sp.]
MWKQIGILLLFSILIIMVYNLLKIFVLEKVKISRWIVLAIAIVGLVFPTIPSIGFTGNIAIFVKSAVFVIFFMWFFDITRGDIGDYKQKKEAAKNKIVIKPKAKPNRAKNSHDEKK